MAEKKVCDERVKALYNEYERRLKERRELEKSWLYNLNYYKGNQYVDYLPNGAFAEIGKRYHWQLNDVFNHIAPIVDARLAKFTQMKTDVTCLPASSDPGDVLAAKFAGKLVKTAEEENGFDSLVSEATYWAEICGTAFYKICWAKDKGRKLTKDNIREGEVEITVCPPYEIFPDNISAKDLSDCRSLMHVRAYPIETIRERWGVEVKSGAVSVIEYTNGYSVGGMGITSLEKEGYALCLEWYELPTETYPQGRMLIVGGDKVLYDGILPYITDAGGKRGFPFVRQVSVPSPGCFFGESLIGRMIPVQKAYNEIKNRKHEFFNRMTAGVLIAEDGSIDAEALEEDGIAPGTVILYRQGCNQPEMMTLGSVPKEFNEEEDRLLKEFAAVSGVNDFLLTGGADGREYSGTALNIIVEQNNNKLGITTDSIKKAIKETASKILRLYKQFATEERLAKIGNATSGEGNAFKKSDISADDIVFDLDDGRINTLSDRRGLAKEIYEMKLLEGKDGEMSYDSKRKLLDLLGCEGFVTTQGTDDLHRKKAGRENEEIGKADPEAEATDDHKIHMEEHIKYLLGEEVRLGVEERNRLKRHIENHRDMLNENS